MSRQTFTVFGSAAAQDVFAALRNNRPHASRTASGFHFITADWRDGESLADEMSRRFPDARIHNL